jgi:hypothetical protein
MQGSGSGKMSGKISSLNNKLFSALNKLQTIETNKSEFRKRQSLFKFVICGRCGHYDNSPRAPESYLRR